MDEDKNIQEHTGFSNDNCSISFLSNIPNSDNFIVSYFGKEEEDFDPEYLSVKTSLSDLTEKEFLNICIEEEQEECCFFTCVQREYVDGTFCIFGYPLNSSILFNSESNEALEIKEDKSIYAFGANFNDVVFTVGCGWLFILEKPHLLLYSSSGVLHDYEIELFDDSFSFTQIKPQPISPLLLNSSGDDKPNSNFDFGKPPGDDKPASTFDFGKPPGDNKPTTGFGFGKPPGDDKPTSTFDFGKPPGDDKPATGFGFGKPPGDDKPTSTFDFGKPPGDNKPTTGFGFGKPPGDDKPTSSFDFGKPPGDNKPATGFGFGKPPGDDKPTSSFDFGKPPGDDKPTSSFDFGKPPGDNKSTTNSNFGFGKPPGDDKPASSFDFGKPPGDDKPTSTSSFDFGKPPGDFKSTTSFGFGKPPGDNTAGDNKPGSTLNFGKLQLPGADKTTIDSGKSTTGANKPASFSFGDLQVSMPNFDKNTKPQINNKDDLDTDTDSSAPDTDGFTASGTEEDHSEEILQSPNESDSEEYEEEEEAEEDEEIISEKHEEISSLAQILLHKTKQEAGKTWTKELENISSEILSFDEFIIETVEKEEIQTKEHKKLQTFIQDIEIKYKEYEKICNEIQSKIFHLSNKKSFDKSINKINQFLFVENPKLIRSEELDIQVKEYQAIIKQLLYSSKQKIQKISHSYFVSKDIYSIYNEALLFNDMISDSENFIENLKNQLNSLRQVYVLQSKKSNILSLSSSTGSNSPSPHFKPVRDLNLSLNRLMNVQDHLQSATTPKPMNRGEKSILTAIHAFTPARESAKKISLSPSSVIINQNQTQQITPLVSKKQQNKNSSTSRDLRSRKLGGNNDSFGKPLHDFSLPAGNQKKQSSPVKNKIGGLSFGSNNSSDSFQFTIPNSNDMKSTESNKPVSNDDKKSEPSSFNFGKPPGSDNKKSTDDKPKSTFDFGKPPGSDNKKATFDFGKPTSSDSKFTSTFDFGKPPGSDDKKSTDDKPKSTFDFGKPPGSDDKPKSTFDFGKPPGSDDKKSETSTFNFGKPTGSDKKSTDDKPTSTFDFGKPPGSDDKPKSTFDFGKPSSDSKFTSTFDFGKPPGSDDKKSTDDKPKSTFDFGKPPGSDNKKSTDDKPKSTFDFGKPPGSDDKPKSTFDFGKPPGSDDKKSTDDKPKSTFDFGKPPGSDNKKSTDDKPKSTFDFGKPPGSDSKFTSTFDFGKPPGSDDKPKSTFDFGKPPGSDDKKSETSTFNFGKPPGSDDKKTNNKQEEFSEEYETTEEEDEEEKYKIYVELNKKTKIEDLEELEVASTPMVSSSKYNFIIFLGNDCIFYCKITDFFDKSLDTKSLSFLNEISTNDIKSLSLSPCQKYIAFIFYSYFEIHSVATILKGVSNIFNFNFNLKMENTNFLNLL